MIQQDAQYRLLTKRPVCGKSSCKNIYELLVNMIYLSHSSLSYIKTYHIVYLEICLTNQIVEFA